MKCRVKKINQNKTKGNNEIKRYDISWNKIIHKSKKEIKNMKLIKKERKETHVTVKKKKKKQIKRIDLIMLTHPPNLSHTHSLAKKSDSDPLTSVRCKHTTHQGWSARDLGPTGRTR
jgi:hypothetical protein